MFSSKKPFHSSKYSFKGCELRQCQLSHSVNRSISKYRSSLTPLTTSSELFSTLKSRASPWSVARPAAPLVGFIATHPSEVAHRLEVDEVAFAWVQRAIPVAVVSVIVTHSEGTGFGKAARWQLGRVVVRRATGLRLAVRHGQRETLLQPQLPLHFLSCLFFNHHLVCTGNKVDAGS